MTSKPWYKSLTILGGAAFVLTQFLESQGVVATGTGTNVGKALEAIVALIGLRRAQGPITM